MISVLARTPAQIITQTEIINNLPTSVSQANRYFKTQYQHRKYNPDGPSASLNSGATSLAMILKLFGVEPVNISVQTSIDLARQYMGLSSRCTIDSDRLLIGIRAAGLQTKDNLLNETWQQLDLDLAAGKPAIGWGCSSIAWRSQFPCYELTGNSNSQHFNTIIGKTTTGNYIICDPMYSGGAVETNRSQLSVFFANVSGGNHGRPYFLSVSR